MLNLEREGRDAGRARRLVRHLRDLNLTDCPVAVSGRERVTLCGCLSLDRPAEQGVSYRLRLADGQELDLCIELRGSGLALTLYDEGRELRHPQLEVELERDREGRIVAADLGARIRLEQVERRALEHFLRRLVKGAWAELTAA